MTSMFLYEETNRSDFDDYRPQVHDSNGLAIRRADGDRFWRALNNPPRLGSSYFAETNPRGFGLFQRDRDFAQYQDAEAHYERRPSLLIEPIGDWGAGHVRLVEIPSDQEVNDNIVAFWIPEQPALAGEEREFRYLMRWGALDVDETLDIAHVLETRTGHGGVSGIENAPDLRKFVVDFKGGMLGRVEAGNEDVEPVVTVSGGEIASLVLKKVDDTDIWRLVIDVSVTGDQAIELVGHVRGFGQKLTETWLYQWMGE
jgi:glucans biosynthesis protein